MGKSGICFNVRFSGFFYLLSIHFVFAGHWPTFGILSQRSSTERVRRNVLYLDIGVDLRRYFRLLIINLKGNI